MRISTGDGEMTTYIAHPDGDGPFPVAVLLQPTHEELAQRRLS